MPLIFLIALCIALCVTSSLLIMFVLGAVAGRAWLLWFVDTPIIGGFVAQIVEFSGVMQFGDGVFGNAVCFMLLMILGSFFLGAATWGFTVIDELIRVIRVLFKKLMVNGRSEKIT